MNIDWGLAVSVILSGMVIVFIILIILICAVTVVSRVLKSASRKSEDSKTAAPVRAPIPTPKVVAPPVVQSGIAEETVAVISAAVCAYADEAANGVSYAVRSVRRADGERPVWGFAGMRQNTRPF